MDIKRIYTYLSADSAIYDSGLFGGAPYLVRTPTHQKAKKRQKKKNETREQSNQKRASFRQPRAHTHKNTHIYIKIIKKAQHTTNESPNPQKNKKKKKKKKKPQAPYLSIPSPFYIYKLSQVAQTLRQPCVNLAPTLRQHFCDFAQSRRKVGAKSAQSRRKVLQSDVIMMIMMMIMRRK
jgi:hypothetical protein